MGQLFHNLIKNIENTGVPRFYLSYSAELSAVISTIELFAKSFFCFFFFLFFFIRFMLRSGGYSRGSDGCPLRPIVIRLFFFFFFFNF